MDENSCVFCKIVRNEIPSYKIYEDESYIAFLDISQFTKGHTLVVPKKHYRFVWDIEDIENYFNIVKKISLHYQNDLGFKYVDSLVFGKLVHHAHVHLVPNNGDDEDWNQALSGLEYLHSDERKLTPEQGEVLVQKFKL